MVTSDRRAKQYKIIAAAYKGVFESANGKIVLNDLVKSHFLRSSFSDDPYSTAYHEGERAVILSLFATLKIEPEKLVDMVIGMEVDDYED